MGRTRLSETSRDLLSPDALGSLLGPPAPGAERASLQLQAETPAEGMPDRVAFPVDSGSLLSLDKYFYSFIPSSSITARLPPRLSTAPQPFPLGNAWTASAGAARCRGKSSLCPDASREAVYLASFCFPNLEAKPRARFYALRDALGLRTRAGL